MAAKSSIRVLKHLSIPYSASYCPSVLKLSTLSSQPFFSETQAHDNDVAKVLTIINSSCSSTVLKRSLQSSGVSISNDLVDRVLRRVRFSHCNPLQALEFFNFTGRLRGFIHTSCSLDTMLYILGRNRKFNLIWDVLIEIKGKDRSLISVRTVNIVLSRVAKVCSVRQTMESFKKFRKLVMEFDTNCFNALLRALCQEKSMTDAKNVYHSLKFDIKPNLQTFNTLLSGWKSEEEEVREGREKERRKRKRKRKRKKKGKRKRRKEKGKNFFFNIHVAATWTRKILTSVSSDPLRVVDMKIFNKNSDKIKKKLV